MTIPVRSTQAWEWDHSTPMVSRPGSHAYDIRLNESALIVHDPVNGHLACWKLESHGSSLTLDQTGNTSTASSSAAEILAALEGAYTFFPSATRCSVRVTGSHPEELIRNSVLLLSPDGTMDAYREMFWQQPGIWLSNTAAPIPLRYQLTAGCRHPVRPSKPTGLIYQRYIPWLRKTFSFRAADIERDLERINRWMNDPVVASVWEEEGDLDKHRGYLQAIAADPHMHAMIACLDGEPFGYFEAYWAKENRVSPFYDVDDYDRGWHVLIGEPAFRGKAFATAWLTSISHYLFLDDPRTRRVVGEPRSDHAQQIRNLDQSGYAKVKEFDLPHKRALLVSLLRERFFVDALWWPRGEGSD